MRQPCVVFVVAVVAALGAGCASAPAADDPIQLKLNDIDARVTRIERIISNQSLVELAQHLDQVQADVRQLRGRVEELEYNAEAMKKQQRDLYSDLDKRIAALGGGSAGAAAAGALGGAAGSAAGSSSPQSTAGGAGSAGSAAAGSGADSGGSSEEQTVYAQSFDALKAGSYSVAITGFKSFLSSYPASPLAENAQYWLGEAFYVTRDFDSATGAFRNVLQKWPDSRKAPDALLKLGYTQLEQKKTGEGRATLSQVVQKYPGTDAAKLATERLQHTPAK
ncbi:MAG TPA: tol-pal system protein YbgF [Steroidobacteraceae bacterium]|nr:tol-pal system protein YbgF [Steroidobacteraceae bacterium]